MTFVRVGLAAALVCAAAVSPPPTYPPVGTTTSILNHAALLGSTPEPAWYEANIPFVDVPDTAIRDTYYYRWRTFKEALKYTGPAAGAGQPAARRHGPGDVPKDLKHGPGRARRDELELRHHGEVIVVPGGGSRAAPERAQTRRQH